MKKGLSIFCIVLILLSFGACKNPAETEQPTTQEHNGTSLTQSAEPQTDALRLRMIDGEGTQRFVLAGEKSGEVYTVSTDELTVYIDGKPAKASDLKNGMMLTFGPEYEILETWPGQITGAAVYAESAGDDKKDHGDLCGLYLQVLEDLWTADSGLNGDITYISVDLEEAPGALTDGEKAAITWIFSGRHNAQGLQLSFDGLRKNGYVEESVLYWKDGVLLSIKQAKDSKDSTKKISFDAEKWRSGTGAIIFMNCTAERGKGVQWKPYQSGEFAIA